MSRRGALRDVRVIDLTTVLMGPLATRMLGDHGADVIRIDSRQTATDIVGQDGLRAISLDLHRNKRSITLDLKSDAGARAARELVATADVLVTNIRAGALERLGLDAASLRAANPGLIHCVANGFGADGPYGERVAYDDVIQAMSGLASLTSKVSGEPGYVPSVIVDKTCSLYIVQAVMAALLNRHATGEGQTIQLPMFETMVSFVLVEHLRGAALHPPRGEIGYNRLLNPNRKPYRCADGWVALLPYTDAHWRDFFSIVGRAELIEDPRFSSHTARVENVVALYQILEVEALAYTVADWLKLCTNHAIPAGPVIDIADLMDDEHLVAVDLFPIVEHPTAGEYHSVRQPIGFDTMATELRYHAPVPGAHTREVMAELGWTDEQIGRL